MHGVEDRLVAGAAVFKQHRVVEDVAAPGVEVLLPVVAGTVRAEVAVRLLERHCRADAGGGLGDERVVAERVGEHGRAERVFRAHFRAPPHETARAVSGVEVARDIGLRHLVWLDLAQMAAQAREGQFKLPLQPAAGDDLARLQRFKQLPYVALRRQCRGNGRESRQQSFHLCRPFIILREEL